MPMTKLGYQIPNFSYPGGGNIFDQVVAQAKAAEAAGFGAALHKTHEEGLKSSGGSLHARTPDSPRSARWRAPSSASSMLRPLSGPTDASRPRSSAGVAP